jgi:SRSO17 transposase
MCPLYVAGLIGPGDRKSVQPMAARASGVGYDQLHHFVAAGVWDSAPLEAALLKEADRLVGDDAGFLVIVDWSGSWQAAWLGNWLGWSPATKAALGR